MPKDQLRSLKPLQHEIQSTGMIPVPEAQVYEELRRLTTARVDLTDILVGLTERLIPVLREADAEEGKTGPIDCDIVPLADRIRTERFKLEQLAAQLRDILGRLEL